MDDSKELEGVDLEARERHLQELREKYVMDRIAFEKTGYNRGKKEGKKEVKIEVAKKLLKLNVDIETIIEVTNLSKEEILKIKNEQ